MPDIATRGTNSELTYRQGDEQIAETQIELTSTPVTLDQTHNREHVICGVGSDVINFTATATLNTNLDSTDTGAEKIGWAVRISNNSGSDVTLNATGVQFNGGTGSFVMNDNCSVIVGFDNISTTKGYFIVAEFDGNTAKTDEAETITATWTFTDFVVNKTITFDGEFDAGTATATATVDWTDGNKQKITLGTSNVTTVTMTPPAGPTNLVLKIIQHATVPKTVAGWNANVNWQEGTAPTVTPTNAAVDIITLYFDGTDYYGAFGLDYQ